MLPTLTDAGTLHGHVHRDGKTPPVASIPKAVSTNPDIYSFSMTSHAVPGQKCYGCNQGMRRGEKYGL